MVGGLIIWAAIGLAFATLLIWIVDGKQDFLTSDFRHANYGV